MSKYQTQKTQFFNALGRFDEILTPKTMIERDALIQRFEFTFDTGWKTLRSLLSEQYSIDAPTPLQAFQEAVRIGILIVSPLWIEMRDMRNMTSHSYSELTAIDMKEKAVVFSGGFATLRSLFEKHV